MRTNPILSFVAHLLVPWDFFFTHRLELVKNEIAHLLPRWLDAWHELEALNSLANFAYLNPHYVFPELSSDANRLVAQRLGHPLLKPEAKVCNDFELDHDQRIVILTGSNMAGKSTFLRTIGVNLCLAYAGAPVNAARLQVSLFRLFTCIKVSDSVQDGLSYFYAEVKRLQALLAAAAIEDPTARSVFDRRDLPWHEQSRTPDWKPILHTCDGAEYGSRVGRNSRSRVDQVGVMRSGELQTIISGKR